MTCAAGVRLQLGLLRRQPPWVVPQLRPHPHSSKGFGTRDVIGGSQPSVNMSSDSERHCCTLSQTQAFHACLRLHSLHRAPRLHRSAQALSLQRRHGAGDRGTKPLQPFEWRYRGKCFQLWFTVAVSRHHELSPGLVQCSGPSVPSHQRSTLSVCNLTHTGCCERDFCLSIPCPRVVGTKSATAS